MKWWMERMDQAEWVVDGVPKPSFGQTSQNENNGCRMLGACCKLRGAGGDIPQASQLCRASVICNRQPTAAPTPLTVGRQA